jgi:ABC-2 type transport system permease protein
LRLSHVWIFTLVELKRILNDRRQILILILGPIVVCLVFGSVYHRSPQDIDVTVFVDQFERSSPFEHEETRQLIADIDRSQVFSVSEVYSMAHAMQRLSDGATRAVIALEEGTTGLQSINVTVDVTDRIIQDTIYGELPPILEAYSRQSAIQYLSTYGLSPEQAAQIAAPYSVEVATNESQDIKSFDLGASGVIVLFVLGISILMSSTAVTSERTRGTIERIFASPYKGTEITLSKILANSVFAIAVAIIIILTLKVVFDIVLGNVLLVLLIATLVGINAAVLGVLVSSVTYTELESVLGAISCWFLSLILMGFAWPLETMHPAFTYISKLIPYSYGVHAMRNVNLTSWGFSQAWIDLAVLLGFVVVQALAAMLVLRREIR